jgi:hypothetical protein
MPNSNAADSTVVSGTKPSDDFTTSDAINCPVTFSIVKSDGSALDGDLALMYTINADGFVEIKK